MTPNSNADREKVVYLDGRVREDLKRADGEDEDADDGQVAAEKGGGGEMDLGLELEARDQGREAELDEGDGERYQSEDDEQEGDVDVVDVVVRHGGGVAEPEGLSGGEIPAERRRRLRDRPVGQHRWPEKTLVVLQRGP